MKPFRLWRSQPTTTGSASLGTGLTGTVLSSLRYTPYGLPRGEAGRLPTPYRYTGQREMGVGFYDYQARLYDPAVGRFVQADTVVPGAGQPQSLNRYAYVLGNPLKYIDSTGHVVGPINPYKVDVSKWPNWTIKAVQIAALVVAGGSELEGNTLKIYPSTSVPGFGADLSIQGPIIQAASNVVDDAATQVANAAGNLADDAVAQVADDVLILGDDEILYQFSRQPGPTGEFRGFPDTLRTKTGETGLSCQVASLCGNDPVQGYQQQFRRMPGSGDWVRETTVGDVKNWGGWVDYDGYPVNPDLPIGHATIYSTDGQWGKPFTRLWINPHPLSPD